jgi:hypothetical protein
MNVGVMKDYKLRDLRASNTLGYVFQKKKLKKTQKNWNFVQCFQDMSRKRGGEGSSGAQKRGPSPSPPDTVGANKKISTPRTSDRSHKTKTTNLNLAQGKTVDAERTATSYFDKGWNAFVQQKDGSYNGFPNRLLELVRIFTARLMMAR